MLLSNAFVIPVLFTCNHGFDNIIVSILIAIIVIAGTRILLSLHPIAGGIVKAIVLIISCSYSVYVLLHFKLSFYSVLSWILIIGSLIAEIVNYILLFVAMKEDD